MPKQIVVDSNLLVLLLVGLTKPSLIGRHKRTRSFDENDYELLTKMLTNYDQIVVTPHIVTETSNLISQIEEPTSTQLREKLRAFVPLQAERYEESKLVVQNENFPRLGLTDSAVLNLARNSIAVVTVDLQLYLAASRVSDMVVNFNHVREASWRNT